jgi:hypothetical protein
MGDLLLLFPIIGPYDELLRVAYVFATEAIFAVSFLGLAAITLLAFGLLWVTVPETKDFRANLL